MSLRQMRSRQVIFAIAAVAVAPAVASGQSITDALALAYQNNGTLAAARAELRATDEGVPEAFGGFLPTLTADGDAGYERTRIRSRGTTDSRADGRPFGYSVTLEQPIFLGGRNFSQLSAAENSVLAQRAELADVEQSVLRSAASAFVDVAQAQSIVRLRENNVAVLERQLQATQDRFSVGEETRTDVAQSESRLAASRAELIAAQGDLSSSIATYVQVIGETPGDVAPPDAPAGLPSALDIATSLARENNPGAISAFFLERAGNDDIDTAQADLLPQLSLRGSYGTDFNSSDSVRRSESALVQGRLTIPLYAGGSEFAQVRRAKQNASRLRSNRVQAEREAVEDATRAWAELRAAEAQIISFQAAIDASQIALEGVRQESLVGSRTVLDVLDAEQELLDAQVDLVGALRDRVVASYELLAAVGALNAETLGLAVDVYDPTVYYDSVRFKAFGLGD